MVLDVVEVARWQDTPFLIERESCCLEYRGIVMSDGWKNGCKAVTGVSQKAPGRAQNLLAGLHF